eukprot:TRINITY_DN454_c2_g1_i3.p2 TRINITY_DN454_c2_g1~~TRINITY_DN454_c2_g1_i3.p2  ORF type:complete len:114 (+),score=0.81 TRINITY_DN454_c2_g1_i3:301-642(+)
MLIACVAYLGPASLQMGWPCGGVVWWGGAAVMPEAGLPVGRSLITTPHHTTAQHRIRLRQTSTRNTTRLNRIFIPPTASPCTLPPVNLGLCPVSHLAEYVISFSFSFFFALLF